MLDTPNTDTRANLQNFLIGVGDGFTRKPDAAENAEQDPKVCGRHGAQALNRAYQRGTAVLNQAITGVVPHDLSRGGSLAWAGGGRVGGPSISLQQDLAGPTSG